MCGHDCRCLPVLRQLNCYFAVRAEALPWICPAKPSCTRRHTGFAHDRRWPADLRATIAVRGMRFHSGPFAIAGPPGSSSVPRQPVRTEAIPSRIPLRTKFPSWLNWPAITRLTHRRRCPCRKPSPCPANRRRSKLIQDVPIRSSPPCVHGWHHRARALLQDLSALPAIAARRALEWRRAKPMPSRPQKSAVPAGGADFQSKKIPTPSRLPEVSSAGLSPERAAGLPEEIPPA